MSLEPPARHFKMRAAGVPPPPASAKVVDLKSGAERLRAATRMEPDSQGLRCLKNFEQGLGQAKLGPPSLRQAKI